MKKITLALIPISLAVFLGACNSTVNSANSTASDSAAVPDKSGIVNVSNKQLKTLLDQNVTLVDIRRPEEWAATGVVPGSKKLTFFSASGAINPNLVPELKRIASPQQPVALICRTGSRTRVASQIVNNQLGYSTIYNVEDGITRWISEGRGVVK